MKKRMFFMVIILSANLLLGAGFGRTRSKDRPAWFDNPSALYPEKEYLVARGAGDTQEAAEDNAAANLAKIFKSDISIDQTTRERYSAFSKLGDTMDELLETEIDQTVRVAAGEILYNVKFSDPYTDNMGRVHILAYLNRQETAKIYRDKINANFEKIQFLLNEAESTSDPITRYACLNACYAISTLNQSMLDQISIIHPLSYNMLTALNEELSLTFISKKRAEAAKNLTFSVSINGDDGRVTSMVSETISNMGFPLIENTGIIHVTGNIAFEEVDLKRNDAEFIGWNLTLKVVGPEDITLVEINTKGREGGVSKEAAKRTALREIGKSVGPKLENQLMAYFDHRIL
ncbi:MAG: LPP20 family lipoprotein [Candidatus Marinimicrobia bacterium]|nr:LPP20 family lipoprotein [Candidatus Neomarinimicrobiota bacterium]